MKNKKLCALITVGLLSAQICTTYASTAITGSNVTVVNNYVGTKDTVTISKTGLTTGDVIKVYSTSAKGTPLGTGTFDGTNDVVIQIDQIGQAAGNLYITNTSLIEPGTDTAGKESAVATVPFKAEVTPKVDTSKVTITNNVDINDTIKIEGLVAGEKVKVCAADGTVLGTTSAATSSGVATLSITKDKLGSAPGTLTVTRTGLKTTESATATVAYVGQEKTPAPTSTSTVITNNVDIADKVAVSGAKKGDVVTIYAKGATATPIGTGKAAADGTVTVTLAKQLKEADLEIEATVKSTNKEVSDIASITFAKQAVSTVTPGSVTVTNNVDIADTVEVSGLTPKDIVTVYAADGVTKIGTAKVATGKTSATVTIAATTTVDGKVKATKQLNEADADIKVTVKSDNKEVSTPATVTFSKQAVTSTITPGSVTVTNNVDKPDTVEVSGMTPKDVVTIYAGDGTTTIGKATIGKTGKATITVNNKNNSKSQVKQFIETDGKIYVTVKNYNKETSTQATVTVATQTQTALPTGTVTPGTGTPASITPGETTVTNNVDKADVVTVKGLQAKDVVTLYAADGSTTIGNATVGKTGVATITINNKSVTDKTKAKQLSESDQKIFLTVKNYNRVVSFQKAIGYDKQEVTTPLDVDKMFVTSNAILISGLTAGDKISVYTTQTDAENVSTTPKAVAVATVGKGNTYAILTLKGQKSGDKLYITNKSVNKEKVAAIATVTLP